MARHAQFPLLTMIDAARSPDHQQFATDPEAVALERHARQLADEFWPEQAFLTGNISRPMLDAVVASLEVERLALHDRMRLVVATHQSVKPYV